MKKQLLLLSSLLLPLVSCSSAGGEASPIDASLALMRRATYQVSFEGTRSSHFPEGYEGYDYTSSIFTMRDYGVVEESDCRAARVYSGTDATTYFEAEDGRMYTQLIRENNQVERHYISSLGMDYYFNKFYYSPFDYLSGDDFDSEGKLSETKAHWLFSSFTGISQPVSGASFTYNEDKTVASIDFTFLPLPVGYLVDSDGNTISVDYTMTGTMRFDYSISKFSYLEPYASYSSLYESAVNNIGNNYTLVASSNQASVDRVLYVTEDEVFLHLDATSSTPVVGDMFYRKRSGTKYYAFTYTGTTWTREESVERTTIFPDYEALSPYLFEDVSSSHLSLKEEAGAYGAEHLLLPCMDITSGTGVKAEIYLDEGSIDYVALTFAYYSGNVNVKNAYKDKGTTSLPLWLEADSIL